MSNHAVVVLEAVEGGKWFIEAADGACWELHAAYPQRYPDGINVSARLTETKTIFTMTGHVVYVKNQLKKLGAERPAVGETVTISYGTLKITSATVAPPPPTRPQNQSTASNACDDGVGEMLDFTYKMMSLSMQGFDS